MMPFPKALGVVLAFVALAGCQHIPQEPLYLDEVRVALTDRPLEIAPIHAYAEQLLVKSNDEAGPFNVEDGLTRTEAQAIALWYNTDARAARMAAEHARHIAAASGRWDDPEVSVSGGRKRVTTDTDTTSLSDNAGLSGVERSWISAAGLSITIPLSGRLGAEKRFQETAVDVADLAAAEAEWTLLAQIDEAWIDWSALSLHLELMEGYLDALAPFRDMSASLAEAGELAPSSARLFSVEYDRMTAAKRRLTGETAAARAAIIGLMGLIPEAPIELIPKLTDYPNPDSSGQITGTHPVLAHAKGIYDLAERSLRVELRTQYPDITLSPSFEDEQDETSLVLGLGMPIPVWNANRKNIAEAVAARDHARLQVEADYQAVLLAIVQARHRWVGAQEAWSHLTENVADVLDVQLEESLSLLRLGELDVVLMHGVLTQTLETKSELLDALAEKQRMAVRIAAATTPDVLDADATEPTP